MTYSWKPLGSGEGKRPDGVGYYDWVRCRVVGEKHWQEDVACNYRWNPACEYELRIDQPNPQEPVVVTQADILLRCGIWNALGNDAKLGRALSKYDMWRFNNTVDAVIANHRIAHAPSQEYGRKHTDGSRSGGQPPSQPVAPDDYEQYRPALQAMYDVVEQGQVVQPIMGTDDCELIRAGLAFAAAIPAQGFCPTCGKPSDSDCSKCAQWWKDNPPPSQHSELDHYQASAIWHCVIKAYTHDHIGERDDSGAIEELRLSVNSAIRQSSPDINVQKTQINADIVKQARADYDLLHVAGMASAHWIERHAMKLMNLAEQSSPDKARIDALEEAAKIADTMASSFLYGDKQPEDPFDRCKHNIASRIADVIRTLANKGIENG